MASSEEIMKELLKTTFWDRLKLRLWFTKHSIWYSITTPSFRKNLRITKQLFILRIFGFKPTELCHYGGEETFIFRSEEEAQKAYKLLEEKLGLLCGWFYGQSEFDNIKKKDFYCEKYWKNNKQTKKE